MRRCLTYNRLYYSINLHDMAKELVCILNIFILSVNACMIGEIIVWHELHLSIAKETWRMPF